MPDRDALGKRKRRTVVGLLLLLGAMVGLVSVSVPLYRLFCAVTGFGGTTQRVEADDAALSDRMITVQFTTSVAPGLPWRFEPEQRSVRLHLGEDKLVFFSAENLTDKPIVGRATFNVTPLKTGRYFKKIECFCFTEERLEPHQKVDMPVEFFVEPSLATDAGTEDVGTITLSYTFFRSTDPEGAQDLGRFAATAAPDAKRGAQLFAQRCAACHALDENRIGPMLGGVFGRAAASTAGYDYSPALRDAGLVWSKETLDKWLANPQAMVAGARMPVRIPEASTRRDIIAYLRSDAGRGSARSAAVPAAQHAAKEP